ncbi:MAG: helix-turn-helix transcriptional regulator [Pandoraea sp.]|nr:helix-turn-helix transcriptional regulator [Pandoraea sp.]MDR3399102.1 helix-turn-helix transcriptional regulator [Pandoraea sp.]
MAIGDTKKRGVTARTTPAAPDDATRLTTPNRLTDWHQHPQGQLIYISAGHFHIRTELGAWLLPPKRAVWIPPDLMHRGELRGVKTGSNILLAPDDCRTLPDLPQVLSVGALLEAVIQRVAQWERGARRSPEETRVLAVLIDEIRAARHEPLHLPMPSDRRLLKMTTLVLSELGREHSLETLASMAGLSTRTARRLFMTSVGMTLSEWRQQARLMRAVEMLAQGESVSIVADALGYASPSNFIAMFRTALGVTPGKYVQSGKTDI